MKQRRDPRSGAVVWIAQERQGRPDRPDDGCPFCPGGAAAPRDYVVRWFDNHWPSMPDARCEVILYAPAHDATFWSLGVDGATCVVDLWAERTAALGRRDDVAYVMPFENRGEQVGATIRHPHGQLYAFDHVPDVPRRELEEQACPICPQLDAGERIVADDDGWRAIVPHAARYPYELLIAPVAHRPDLPSLDDASRRALATVLVDALARLDRLFSAPMPYMLWVHQRPTDGADWPTAHVHVEVAPLYRSPGTPRYVAAGELGSGVWFNPVDPEEAARRLRDA